MAGPRPDARRDESAWIARARLGDLDAFDALVERHYVRLFRTAFHLVGNHEDAEDLTQEAFLKAHRGLRWYRGSAPFHGWLRRILVHLVRDRFRRRGRRPVATELDEGELAGERAEPFQRLRRAELGRLLERAIERLPEAQRIALLLRVRDGAGYDEISDATGVTPATARTQVMKARRALLESMRPYLEERER